MSTVTLCDVCSEPITDLDTRVVATVPPSWWTAMGYEVVNDPIDICSPLCMSLMAEAATEPSEADDEEEEEVPVDQSGDRPQPVFQPQAASFRPVHDASREQINEALGITERG